ncbi:Replication protein A 70 kDa DNA-binding subunit D [Linum perenne]
MAKSATPDAISTLLSIPKPDSPSDLPEIVVQVTNLQPKGKAYGFDANDGNMKLRSLFNSWMTPEIISGTVQNLGLVRILDYTINEIPNKAEKYMIVTSCEVVSPALESEIKNGPQQPAGIVQKPKLENEAAGFVLKPNQDTLSKSASQIVNEQRGNMAPTARMAMTRRVHPLVSLNPYQGNWTIKVRVTSKGTIRNYKNMGGEGCLFNVELTDEDGTQIQATMFNEAAKEFYERFQLGKVYYISRGSLRVANKRYNTVPIPKRDVVIADESKKTVIVSLWNELATTTGQELLDMADKSPVVAIKALKVGDFQGVTLSTIGKTMLQVNPDIPESKQLRSWYDSDGKHSLMAPIGSGMSPSIKSGMWYRACKTCNKKLTDCSSGYWCEGCQRNDFEYILRYILVVKVRDMSGEGFISSFTEEAEQILGCTVDELEKMQSENNGSSYEVKLKEATWNQYLFRISVTQYEYKHEKRQRIIAKAVNPVDYAAESKLLLEDISKKRLSSQ